MHTVRADFASDNVAGIAPEALQALIACNEGLVGSYGEDAFTARAADLIRGMLDADAEVYFCSSGTAANAISLAALCEPFESVVAHEHAHIFTDEAGAPGFFGQGIGSIQLPGASGKIADDTLRSTLELPETTASQAPGVVSFSNVTEYGALYEEAALQQLADTARAHACTVHLDGARLSNAAAAGFDLKSLKRIGVDIAVVGGAKSGMPPTEAIVILNRAFVPRFRIRLKQAGQLISKSRFTAAPWIGMLESGAWIARAQHANAMAAKLAASMPLPIAHPVESNAVFVHMDEDIRARLRKSGWRVYRFADGSVRFMCSWATSEESVTEVCQALRGVI